MRYLYLALFWGSLSFAQAIDDPLLTKDWEAQQKWVDSIYAQMDTDEKIGQLFMVMAFSEQGEAHFKQIKRQVKEYHLGGIIFSLGGPVEQTHWLNKLQQSSKTPLLIGMDAEWGVAMRLDSVQAFPWNMTLGAIQDNKLVEAVGHRIGEQAKRLGVHINFAPDVDINTNPKNPIIGNRSFGEEKENVTQKGLAFMKGMHQAGVLSSAKHFPGHGDTAKDSHLDLPVIRFDQDRLLSTEIYPFDRLIKAGVSSVMVGHLNVPALEEGIPSSLSKKIIQEILIKRNNYKGLIVTDALNMGAASEVSKINSIDVAAFLAGNDILLIPNDLKKAVKKMKRAFKQGQFTEERLTLSVKKILKAKYKVGLANFSPIPTATISQEINTPKDDYLIHKAMDEAITLVKNDAVLPLKEKEIVGFLSLGDVSGEHFYKSLKEERILQRLTFSGDIASVLNAAKNLSTIVVGFHRSNANPWKNADFSPKERALLKALNQKHKVVLATFVKPYALSKLEDLPSFEGIIVGYQNNKAAQKQVAQLLLWKKEAKGKLPVSIHPEFPAGHGINTTSESQVLKTATPFELGIDANKLLALDQLAQTTLDSLVAPGFQILAARNGKIFYHKAFGHHTFDQKQIVQLTDVYDVASLTKVLATLPLLMQEVDQGKMTFESTLGELSAQFKGSNKADLTLKEVLSHQAGITPWIPFYKETLRHRDAKRLRKYYRSNSSKRFPIEVAKGIYGRASIAQEQFDVLLNSDLIEKGYHYSDLPFIFMQHILEERYKKGLDQLAQKNIFTPLGLKSTVFNAHKTLPQNRIVPSEIDDYFRKQELKGYVHDMTAALIGGIGSHAGLFSNALEVATIMQMYLQKGSYAGNHFFNSATFDAFNQCYYCDQDNRRGVGLDKPQLWGGGMAFNGISAKSFGHAGFTGTYAWVDPETQIVFVFLSNRTYPSAKNRKLIDQSIRPRMLKLVHDAILY
jgi:beta-glucosidase-like glycosyl hydrolase/CubicO group peptidase (beta-lactamase class C family)